MNQKSKQKNNSNFKLLKNVSMRYINPSEARKTAQSLVDRITGNTKPKYSSDTISEIRSDIRTKCRDQPFTALFELYLIQRTTEAFPAAINKLHYALYILRKTPSDFEPEIKTIEKHLSRFKKLPAPNNVHQMNAKPKQSQSQNCKSKAHAIDLPQIPAKQRLHISAPLNRHPEEM